MQNENGTEPLTSSQKTNLVKKLMSDRDFYTQVLTEEPESVYRTFKEKVRGLSLHGKQKYHSETYFKCSIYKQHDPQGPYVNKQFFESNLVCHLINKNKDTVIINDIAETYDLTQNYVPPQTSLVSQQ